MNIRRLNEQLKEFNKRISLYGGGRYLACWADLICSGLRFGASPADYFNYEFNRKSNYEKNRFTTYRRSQRLIKTYNDPGAIDKVLDKRISNRIFAEFISRRWIDTGNCTFEDFRSFVIRHGEVIIKPARGGAGKGICKYSSMDRSGMEQKFSEIKGSLVEEVINQHGLMKSLNPSSVNGVRIVTFFDGKRAHIIVCYLKMGASDNIIDNTDAGGLFAKVDIETGIVFTSCINKYLQRCFIHPVSGVQVTGLRVPHWPLLLDTVQKAAMLVPCLKYLGWDFAIMERGVEFIEANHDPSHFGQAVDQGGTYESFKRCISELKRHEKEGSTMRMKKSG
ncbi:MAG TPA: sugar-transfer associated ATP-grasp domain-containing protein [bacterium]|nr:sugar-transfer associated ATP-grasp domain-containing protein [bacterium]